MKDLAPADNSSFSDETVRYEYLFRLNRAIDYIQKHYDEDLNLTKLAEIACFSKFHFHRLFRTFVGETLNDFVRRFRLEKAVHKLILEKHKSITDIALDCGFSSSQNFAKAFKSYFGVNSTFIRDKFSWKIIPNKGENRETLQRSMIPSRGVMKNREEAKTISVRISDIPSYQVAYIRRIGPYQPERMTSVFSRLLQWAAPRGLWDGNSILIGTVWNNPRITPKDKCICDACITVPESLRFTEGVNIQSLPGGKFAVYRCEIGPRDFPEAWRRLISHWLLSSDYQPDDRPSYVLYHEGGPPPLKPWKVDLCLAIKPLGLS